MQVQTLVQFLHLLVTVLWIGGMLFMAIVLNPSLHAIEPSQRGRLMASVAKRFTIVAWVSVITLLVTGLIQTPSTMLFDSSAGFARLLFIKQILFAIMIVIGLIITLGVAPKLMRNAPRGDERPSAPYLRAMGQVELLSKMNTVLGLGVLFLVSLFP